MNEPRPGKRLLVLDLDYSTLLICWYETILIILCSHGGHEAAHHRILTAGRVRETWIARVSRTVGQLSKAQIRRSPGYFCRVYPHYDIVIWSQTHWRWLETKLVELGVIGGTRNYKVVWAASSLLYHPRANAMVGLLCVGPNHDVSGKQDFPGRRRQLKSM